MAIQKIGTDTNTTHPSDTVYDFSWTHTLVAGSNRIVVVSVGGETTNADTSPIWYASNVTYGGQAMTQAILAQTTETTGSNNSTSIWYLLDADLPSDGLQTIQVTGAGANAGVELFGVCCEYSGVFQGLPQTTAETFVNATAPSDTISNTISPVRDCWVVSSYCCGNVGSWTVGESQVEIYDQSQDVITGAGCTYGACELRDAVGNETTLSSTYVSGANRLTRVAASFRRTPWKINTVSEAGEIGSVNTTPLSDISEVNTYIT